MPGTLYVVSTPIGNLDDITVRALHTLKSVGLIAAEDTRRTAHLLQHFDIHTPLTSLHEHNEQQKWKMLRERLAAGVDVALVSDAGTPLVADPGHRLITHLAAEGIRIVPIPGASAVLSALVASGFPADQFVFAGFAPAKSADRKRWFQELAAERRTVVYFEVPHRIKSSLAEARRFLGNRQIYIGRELTKRFEEGVHTSLNMANALSMAERGEFTLVLGPISESDTQPQHISDKEITEFFYQRTKSASSRREAIAMTAAEFGLSTKDVYARIERAK